MTKPVVILIIGIPGAGKSTLIDRAANPSTWTVLDPDRLRRRLPQRLRHLPIPYPLYVLSIIVAIPRESRVVIESRNSNTLVRRLVAVCSRLRGREAALILLDASAEDAVAGQVGRGRVAPSGVMRWNETTWRRLLDAAHTGALAREGWSQVMVLDRAQASRVNDLDELVGGVRGRHRDLGPETGPQLGSNNPPQPSDTGVDSALPNQTRPPTSDS